MPFIFFHLHFCLDTKTKQKSQEPKNLQRLTQRMARYGFLPPANEGYAFGNEVSSSDLEVWLALCHCSHSCASALKSRRACGWPVCWRFRDFEGFCLLFALKSKSRHGLSGRYLGALQFLLCESITAVTLIFLHLHFLFVPHYHAALPLMMCFVFPRWKEIGKH